MSSIIKKIVSFILILVLSICLVVPVSAAGKRKYDDVGSFSDGLAIVAQGAFDDIKFGFVDKTGKEIVKPKYDEAERFSDGIAKVTKGKK